MTQAKFVSELPKPPPRPRDAHKGTFGRVLIVAGSEGMGGAAALTGRAALHGGAGLVTVAIPRSVSDIVAHSHNSYMTIPLYDDEKGRISDDAISQIDPEIEKANALALGPGVGLSEGVRKVVQHIYSTSPIPVVLDADGLNTFVGQVDRLQVRANQSPRILTPHPGEFARLTGLDGTMIDNNRERHAAEFAEKHNVILLLKGHKTVITDGKKIAVNSTGGPGLATGGSGDVFTGLIASLISQGMDAFDAAQFSAHLHGLTGEIVAERFTDRFVTSSELVDHLFLAWKRIL